MQDASRTAWQPFFQAHALPLVEAEAFREYLEAHAVQEGVPIQDLRAHYDHFVEIWDPDPAPHSPRERRKARGVDL